MTYENGNAKNGNEIGGGSYRKYFPMTSIVDDCELVVGYLYGPRGYMKLYIKCGTPELVEMYKEAINAHCKKILDDPCNIDAGFDLFVADAMTTEDKQITVNHHITCRATLGNSRVGVGYYMYPRSSITKTPLRLINSVGVIDAGYRGEIMAKFDNIGSVIVLTPGLRLVQLCAPTLVPIIPVIVDDLGDVTMRGEGGFGSTGAVDMTYSYFEEK